MGAQTRLCRFLLDWLCGASGLVLGRRLFGQRRALKFKLGVAGAEAPTLRS